jgi:CRISPR-associated endoribonuclease Cas6
MYNKIYELSISVYLNKNINQNDMYEKIAEFMNYSMNKSKLLSVLHKGKDLKHYSLSGLYPIETDRIYKADETYNFLIRSYKKDIINEFEYSLKSLSNEIFNVIMIIKKEYDKSNVQYVDTLTPTMMTKDFRCWSHNKDTKEEFLHAIFNNLCHKYNTLQGIRQEFNMEDIIENFEIKSKCAIITNYKGIKLLGYKLRVYFKNNNIAQEFANLSIAEGLGEKNSSCGQGFTKPYFRREN